MIHRRGRAARVRGCSRTARSMRSSWPTRARSAPASSTRPTPGGRLPVGHERHTLEGRNDDRLRAHRLGAAADHRRSAPCAGAESGPARKMAAELADRFTVATYDRRGRGESGDTAPYSVKREVEDIEALIGEIGGRALRVRHLLRRGSRDGGGARRSGDRRARRVYEAPFIVDDSRDRGSVDLRDGPERPARRRTVEATAVKRFVRLGWNARRPRGGDAAACRPGGSSRGSAHTLPYDAAMHGRHPGPASRSTPSAGAPSACPRSCSSVARAPSGWQNGMQSLRRASAERATPGARGADAHGQGEGARADSLETGPRRSGVNATGAETGPSWIRSARSNRR